MAKRRKKSKGSRSRKRTYTKKGLMGLPNDNQKATTTEKVVKGALLLATAVLVGGTAGAYAGKASGTVGAGLILGAPFVPAKYTEYMLAAGAGMLVSSPKEAPSAPPEPVATSGIGSLDSAKEFHAQGVSRVKNFASDFASKLGLKKPVDKALGLGDVAFYTQDSVVNTDPFRRMLEMSRDNSMGSTIDPLLAGTQRLPNALLAGVPDSILY